MPLNRISMVACLLVGMASALIADDGLKSKLASVHYAPLAEQARIQGDVLLNINGDVVTVLSGHPLLAPAAVASAKAVASRQGQTNLEVTYHFVLVETTRSVPTVTTVKRGNAFERAILRVFGAKTEKVVHGYRCEEGSTPSPDVKVNGLAIEVWVYGGNHCLQISSAMLVAKR